MTNAERNPKTEARSARWRTIHEFGIRVSEFLRISSFVIWIWEWLLMATVWHVFVSRQRARIPDGPLVLFLFTAMLLSHSIPLRAAETKSADNPPKPIPIAKLKHSKPVDFDKEILPILKNNCLACHNKTTAKGRLVLETPQDILKGGDSGPAAAPKQSSSSLMLKAASHQIEDTVMPPPANKVQASDLTPEELGLIKLWIDQGAKASANIVRPIEWQPLSEGLNPIYAVALTPDGQFAACARANQIFIYHLPSQQLAGLLTDPQLIKSGLYAKPGVAHRSMVHSLAFSPDGSLLASGGHREVKIWRRPKDAQKFRLMAVARKEVLAVAASSNGKWLATGGDDGRIKIWNVANGKLAKNLNGHKGAIHSLKFSGDNTLLASAAADKTLRVWGVPAGKPLARARSESSINAVTWLDDTTRIASGGVDKQVRIWRFDAGKPELTQVKELIGHEGPVTALDNISSADAQIISGSEDGSVRLWNLETGNVIREIKQGGPVAALAVRRDGKRFASAGADKIVRLWDLNDGKEIAQLKGDRYAQEFAANLERALIFAKSEVDFHKAALKSAETNHAAQIERVKKATEASEATEKAFAEKQKKLMEASEAKAAVEKMLEAAKAEARKTAEDLEAADKAAKQAEAEAKTTQETPGQDKVEKAAAEAAAKSKAAAEARKNADKASTEAKQKEKEATEKLTAATKTVDGAEKELKKAEQTKSTAETELQLAGKAAEAAAEAVTQGKEAIQQADDFQKETEAERDTAKKAAADSDQPVRAIAFSPDHLTLATAGADGLIHLWSAENGAAFETLSGHKGAVQAIVFASNGRLASGAADRSVVIWDLNAEWKLDRMIGTGDSGSPLVDRVNAVRFSPDGKWLATGGGEPTRDGEIKLWQANTGNLIRSFTNVHSDAVFSLDFSPDGKYLASGAADKFVKVIELGTGKIVKQFEGHTHHVLGVSWNRNERSLASAGADNVVKIWDFVKGEKTKNIAGFDKEVTSISFVGYTDQALAASGDAKVRLVREDASDVRSFAGATDFIESAAVTPDGKVVIAGGQDSILRVWDGTNGKLLASFPPP
jgi:WD40 repeat protein